MPPRAFLFAGAETRTRITSPTNGLFVTTLTPTITWVGYGAQFDIEIARTLTGEPTAEAVSGLTYTAETDLTIGDDPYFVRVRPVGGAWSRPVPFYVTPLAVGTMFLWLQGDYGTYQDAAGTLPATATGDPVGKWLDRSGQGNYAQQTGDTGLKLRILENAINGRTALKPDGVDDAISIPHSASLLPSGLHMYVVFESPTGTGAFRVLSKDGDAGYRLYRDAVNTNLRVNFAGSSDTQISSPPTGWMIARLKYNRTRIAFKVTGKTEVTLAHTAAMSGTGALIIPYSGTDKPIYAVLGYAAELGTTQQAALEAYLTALTGLAV